MSRFEDYAPIITVVVFLLILSVSLFLIIRSARMPWPDPPDMIAECKRQGGSVLLREASGGKLVFDRCLVGAKP